MFCDVSGIEACSQHFFLDLSSTCSWWILFLRDLVVSTARFLGQDLTITVFLGKMSRFITFYRYFLPISIVTFPSILVSIIRRHR